MHQSFGDFAGLDTMHRRKEREVLAASESPIKAPLLATHQPDGPANIDLLTQRMARDQGLSGVRHHQRG